MKDGKDPEAEEATKPHLESRISKFTRPHQRSESSALIMNKCAQAGQSWVCVLHLLC